ncbi:hypothetical protein O9992_01710 [Vibrio lentus]|nr:hypothetical protein [Vibrio lentus]
MRCGDSLDYQRNNQSIVRCMSQHCNLWYQRGVIAVLKSVMVGVSRAVSLQNALPNNIKMLFRRWCSYGGAA